jgi:hypothetical protein
MIWPETTRNHLFNAPTTNRVTLTRLLGLLPNGLALPTLLAHGTARAQAEHPLDRYPGFGRSPAAILRDDTTASWEAFKREKQSVVTQSSWSI